MDSPIMANQINMVRCPYCSVEFINEDKELYCKNCGPQVLADLAVVDLIEAVDKLKALAKNHIKSRSNLIKSAIEALKGMVG